MFIKSLPIFFVIALHSLDALAAIPTFDIDRINSIPDFMQTSRPDLLPGGYAYCGPVAVSNSLMWLSSNGLPRLAPEKQAELVSTLVSNKYMNTSLEDGTGPYALLEGLKRYILDSGYTYKRIEGQGFRRIPPEFDTKERSPQLEWIKQKVHGAGSVWLLIAWVKYDPRKDEYLLVGGHYVTVVGYGMSRSGQLDPSILIVHDSSDRAGHEFSNQYVKVRELYSGVMIKKANWTREGYPRNASGLFSLEGEMKIKAIADFGIVEGAYVLTM